MSVTAFAPSRRARRPEARTEEVLDAALDLFARHGFASTRMEDVARAAGLSKGAVYLYFPSKEELFKALVETRTGELRARIEAEASAAREHPLEGLRAITVLWASAMEDPRLAPLPRILFAEAPRFPALAAYYESSVIGRMQAAMVPLLDSAMERGLLARRNPVTLLRLLMAPMVFEVLRRQAFGAGDSPDLATLAADAFDIFLHGAGRADGPA